MPVDARDILDGAKMLGISKNNFPDCLDEAQIPDDELANFLNTLTKIRVAEKKLFGRRRWLLIGGIIAVGTVIIVVAMKFAHIL